MCRGYGEGEILSQFQCNSATLGIFEITCIRLMLKYLWFLREELGLCKSCIIRMFSSNVFQPIIFFLRVLTNSVGLKTVGRSQFCKLLSWKKR